MKIMAFILILILQFSSLWAAEFIGAPLNSFRRQVLENCWAVSGLQYLEAAIQAQTGISYTFAQDETFWYEVFKQRLLNRWKKKAELSGGLSDNNIFTDFGFPEAIVDLVKNKKLAFYKIVENQVRKPGNELLRLRPYEQVGNQFRRLRFSSKFKESLLSAVSEKEALEKIDSFLKSEGLKPGADDFRLGRTTYSRKLVMNSILSIPQVEEAMDLVWVTINDKKSANQHGLSLTDSNVQYLTGPITTMVAQELAEKMWVNKLPVLVSSKAHSWLIVAKDTQSSVHLVADSKNEAIKRDSYPWTEVVTMHLPRKILEDYLQQKLVIATPGPILLSTPSQK